MKKLFAITSKGKTLKSFLDVRFGRCENIVIYDPAKNDHAILHNPFKDADYSGVKLIEFLEKNHVTAIITGEVGPLVQEKLEKEKIQLILLEEDRIKIEEVISRIKSPE